MRSIIQRAFMIPRWFAVLIITASCFAQAQSRTATIIGTVKDPTGWAIPKATVALQTANGAVQQTTADAAGRFAIDIEPGDYSLNISARGFDPLREPISLAAATTLTKHIILLLPSLEECGPCVVFVPIELEAPDPLTATLPLEPLPPLKSHQRDSKSRPQ
jgi:hypothetical protein